jgi:hypothetical protein
MWKALKHFHWAFLQLNRSWNQKMVAIQKRSNLPTASVEWFLIVQQDWPASKVIIRILSVTKYTGMVCFRHKWIDFPAYSTKIQRNHREESAANDICGFTRRFLQRVPRKTVTTQWTMDTNKINRKKKHVEVRRSQSWIDFLEFVEALSKPGGIVFQKTVHGLL